MTKELKTGNAVIERLSGGAPLKASHSKGLRRIDASYCHYEEKQTEQSAKWSAQSDVVISNKNLRHAEGAQVTEASHNFSKRIAFTLAEVLITLGVIGVVAALTMPTLLKNIAERSNSEAQANLAQKITKSMDLMRADGGLERTYNSTDEFVDEFSKYIKISTRCDADHIADCWPTKTVTTTDGETYDVSKAKTGKNLNLKDNKSNNVGIILADGATLILTYNPNAGIIGDGDTVTPSFVDLPIGFGRTKKFAYTTSVTDPIDFVMDVNGFKGPNSEARNGKQYDIRSFKVARFSKGCAGNEIKGIGCVYQLPSYSPIKAGSDEMKKWDPKWNTTDWKGYDNYWAGAKKACDDIGMSLPDKSKLQSLAKKTTAEKKQLGLPTSGWFWSSSEYGADHRVRPCTSTMATRAS